MSTRRAWTSSTFPSTRSGRSLTEGQECSRVNTARATLTWRGRGSTRRRLSPPFCYWPSCLSNSTSRFLTLGYLSCGTIWFQIPPPVYYTPPSEQAAILANPATNTLSLYVHSCFYPQPPHRPHGRCWLRRNDGLRWKKKLENLVLVAEK